jgi:hypothetical protein
MPVETRIDIIFMLADYDIIITLRYIMPLKMSFAALVLFTV